MHRVLSGKYRSIGKTADLKLRTMDPNNLPESELLNPDKPENTTGGDISPACSGRKSVHRVTDNIKRLKEKGIDVSVRITLVSTNPFICETCDFFEKLEVPFNLVFAYQSENKSHSYAEYGRQSLDSIKAQLDRLLVYYKDKCSRGEPIYNRILAESVRALKYRVKSRTPCSAGINFFTVTADGDIFSCAHLMNDAAYRIGDIQEGLSDRSAYVPVNVDEIEDCKDCWVKYLCMGGCVSQKISTGRNNRRSYTEEQCRLSEITWEFYISMYYNTMRTAPQYITAAVPKERDGTDC